MGKIIKGMAYIYSDAAMSNLVGHLPYYIGLATGDCRNVNPVRLTDVNFFVSRVSDYTNLGGSLYIPDDCTIYTDFLQPHLFFPLCNEKNSALWQPNYYISIQFSNGSKMVKNGTIWSTSSWSLYAASGNLITSGIAAGDVYCSIFTLWGGSSAPANSGRSAYCTLVFSSFDAEGHIAQNSEGAYYWISGAVYGVNNLQAGISHMSDWDVAVWREFFNEIPPLSADPYSEIPQSETSVPSGTYDFTTSDDIGVPQLPALSAVNTGFISLWAPTEEQMLKLSSFMWNANPLTIEFWKKIVADPMQLIYGLNIIPLDLDSMGMIDGAGNVVVGLISTGITMNHLSGQWVELDCGEITLDETWSAYLDYDPYTKLEIYLPYCGTHPLKVDDFMPGKVKLTYHIDLLSGACVAILTSTKSDKHGDTLNSVVYEFMGNCAAQIPVTASQYADAVRSVIQLAASVGAMIAGAAGAGAAAAASESAALPASTGLSISSGTHAAAAMVENVMGIKPNIERSGAIGATGGLLSVQVPYLILTRPRQARPEDQNAYTGYPSFITETLNDLEGWTQVQAIHLENIPCTADEMTEIDGLLKSGVIF